ncbi:hypothetical protein ebA3074 [Aromatoleum aromaticum EbN1]|uniref:Uncharacterized protein n=1 Tax=Aromatoleum aromaticum (strain DSM 19018 / LMG 30748 / EbN1) TaxID=76114 RepID=Q5P4A6_AROAE|nr:hypothetical protein ebA3074 [Aromatoleum aromaticum EbN1]
MCAGQPATAALRVATRGSRVQSADSAATKPSACSVCSVCKSSATGRTSTEPNFAPGMRDAHLDRLVQVPGLDDVVAAESRQARRARGSHPPLPARLLPRHASPPPRAIELDYRRRVEPQQHIVKTDNLRPVIATPAAASAPAARSTPAPGAAGRAAGQAGSPRPTARCASTNRPPKPSSSHWKPNRSRAAPCQGGPAAPPAAALRRGRARRGCWPWHV